MSLRGFKIGITSIGGNRGEILMGDKYQKIFSFWNKTKSLKRNHEIIFIKNNIEKICTEKKMKNLSVFESSISSFHQEIGVLTD